jgi:MATE family multidrug resistance protein
MVGNALGAGDEREARQVVHGGMVLSTAIMTVLGLAIVLGAEPIIAIFDIDPATELGRYSILWMRILGLGMPIVGVHIALIGMLRGAGATNTSLMINIVGTMIIQVPLSWFLGFVVGWGAFGIWVAMPISFVVRLGLGVRAYRRGAWAQTGATI